MDNNEALLNRKTYKIKVDNELYSEEDFLKDCPNSQFVPTVLPPVKRVIAIGDIHGDYNLAVKSFKLANLIDDDLNWIADPEDTVVVQVGDQIDSCRPIPGVYDCRKKRYPGDSADDIKCFNFFNEMNEKAQHVGGAVYSLLGNHELMNSQAKFPYVSYENYYNFSYEDNGIEYFGPKGRKNAFKPGGPLAKMLACNRLSVLVIGSTMFVHAGVLPVLAKRLENLNFDAETKLKYLNAIVRKWLLHKLEEETDIKNKILFIDNDKLSPFWTRIYGSIPENINLNTNECFNSVKKTMEVFKIGHIVVGHTPQLFTNKNGINGTCYEKNGDNKLFRVDGGFSRAFKIFDNQNLVQVLEIIDDNIFNIITDTTIDKSIYDPQKQPYTNISDNQMKQISKIYSQNKLGRQKN